MTYWLVIEEGRPTLATDDPENDELSDLLRSEAALIALNAQRLTPEQAVTLTEVMRAD